MRSLITLALLFSAVPASAAPECLSKPGPGGTIIFEVAPGSTPVELWRFGERLGTTPVKLNFSAGCVQLEAKIVSAGVSQSLRLEVEPGVEKTLRVDLTGASNALRIKAESLFAQAVAGDIAAKNRVLELLERGMIAEAAKPK
jgi:hypothetical protein